MEKFCNVFLMTFFGNIMAMTSRDVITDFLKFDFVIISLKKQNLATLRNSRSPRSKIKGRWGAESSQRLAIFESLLLNNAF